MGGTSQFNFDIKLEEFELYKKNRRILILACNSPKKDKSVLLKSSRDIPFKLAW
jgi:hypothetical protein